MLMLPAKIPKTTTTKKTIKLLFMIQNDFSPWPSWQSGSRILVFRCPDYFQDNFFLTMLLCQTMRYPDGKFVLYVATRNSDRECNETRREWWWTFTTDLKWYQNKAIACPVDEQNWKKTFFFAFFWPSYYLHNYEGQRCSRKIMW